MQFRRLYISSIAKGLRGEDFNVKAKLFVDVFEKEMCAFAFFGFATLSISEYVFNNRNTSKRPIHRISDQFASDVHKLLDIRITRGLYTVLPLLQNPAHPTCKSNPQINTLHQFTIKIVFNNEMGIIYISAFLRIIYILRLPDARLNASTPILLSIFASNDGTVA